jgi:CHAP domain
MSWWDQANPGGPMVGPPMIRPLYPPDANQKGKAPSDDGGDVIAIKRAVSRSGHWPWQNFDGAYSNSFSHGRSGNVSENGLAGLQRQNGIDATGWMGEGTYNLIRSARIPNGLPHAGEPILDDVAIDMLFDYQAIVAGGDKLRERALAKAVAQLGYKESPSGSNGNMFGAWYGMNYEPWCAMFCTWCYETSGDSPSFVKGSRYSYVPYIVSDARAGRYGLTTTGDPIPGDLVCYDWDGDVYDHVGIFEEGSASVWNAIEGNTSTSSNSNGGQVMRRSRARGDAAAVTFVRVAEP